MKKFLLCILILFSCLTTAYSGNPWKRSFSRSYTHHTHYRPVKHNIKPSWMTEEKRGVRQRNPFTGQRAKQRASDPNKYYFEHTYLNQYALNINAGFKNVEYPYYQSNILDGSVSYSFMPTIGANFILNLGCTQRNFGFLGGCTYSISGLPKKGYEFMQTDKYSIVDYRVGITLMKYASIGFEGEYNGYFKNLHGEGYSVDKNHYGFYVMGMYKFLPHLGAEIDFSYIFNKQYYNYNLAYNKAMYTKQGCMRDFRISVGLIIYF